MPVNWKDVSEIAKNLVSTAAVIVGGVWVLYQWDTLFPKTRAEVQAAAATVRTDVSGTFGIQLDLNEDGSSIPFKPGSSAAEDVGLQEYCMANPAAVLMQAAPVFGQLVLKSASSIPVGANIENIQLATAPIGTPMIVPRSNQSPGITPVVITNVATVSDNSIFFGGLRENRIEKGQEVQVAFMFNAEIPVQCSQLERIVLFRAQVALTAIDPARDRPVGPPVPKIFVTACQLNPRTGPDCNIKGITARGQ